MGRVIVLRGRRPGVGIARRGIAAQYRAKAAAMLIAIGGVGGMVLAILLSALSASRAPLALDAIAPAAAKAYMLAEIDTGVHWMLMAAADQAARTPQEEITAERARAQARAMAPYLPGQPAAALGAWLDDAAAARRAVGLLPKFRRIEAAARDKLFPIPPQYAYTYGDSWGAPRTEGGERQHEGIDIMAEKGVPIRAAAGGVVEKKGWLTLGGRRIGIRGEDGLYYYYAHMDRYADVEVGGRVEKGQIIGYVGDSGYGPPGTEGKFPPHLHFGLYETSPERAVYPYALLRLWEAYGGD